LSVNIFGGDKRSDSVKLENGVKNHPALERQAGMGRQGGTFWRGAQRWERECSCYRPPDPLPHGVGYLRLHLSHGHQSGAPVPCAPELTQSNMWRRKFTF